MKSRIYLDKILTTLSKDEINEVDIKLSRHLEIK